MNKPMLNYIVDILLLIAFIVVSVTGIIKFPGLLLKFGVSVKDLPLHAISKAHDWWGIAMVVLVVVHLVLNWNFMVVMTKKIFKRDER